MSLPPDQRVHSIRVRHRLREALWALAAVILLCLLASTIAPDSWRRAIPHKLSRMWHRVYVQASDPHEPSTQPLAGPVQPPAENKSVMPPEPQSATAMNGKAPIPMVEERNSPLPTDSGFVARSQNSSLKINQITATLVRTPEYKLIGGTPKPFTPKPWIEVAVTFSTTREFERIAIRYELNAASPVFSDAITYDQVPRGESLTAAAYLIPARTRLISSGRPGASAVRQFRVSIFEKGTLIAQAESGGAPPKDAEYQEGFIRPRSLTPFAPLQSDLFLPDSGFADPSDLSPKTGRSLTRTSPGK